MTTWSLVASLILLCGAWVIGSRSRWGFACTIAGELAWVVIALNRGMWDLAVLCVAFALVAGRNFYRWSREG